MSNTNSEIEALLETFAKTQQQQYETLRAILALNSKPSRRGSEEVAASDPNQTTTDDHPNHNCGGNSWDILREQIASYEPHYDPPAREMLNSIMLDLTSSRPVHVWESDEPSIVDTTKQLASHVRDQYLKRLDSFIISGNHLLGFCARDEVRTFWGVSQRILGEENRIGLPFNSEITVCSMSTNTCGK